MSLVAQKTPMTAEEYLAFERAAPERHEFASGEVLAMSGGTAEHSAIAANIIATLHAALRGRGCRVFTSDMRVAITATGRYVYPDVSVACGGLQFQDSLRDILVNPTLVVEVLSESTEAYDRGDKFAQYRTVESIRTYVLASQTEPRIEVYTRQPNGGWLLLVRGPGEFVELTGPAVSFAVDDVYRDVFGESA